MSSRTDNITETAAKMRELPDGEYIVTKPNELSTYCVSKVNGDWFFTDGTSLLCRITDEEIAGGFDSIRKYTKPRKYTIPRDNDAVKVNRGYSDIIFLGKPVDYWIELEEKAESLNVTELLAENARMRRALARLRAVYAESDKAIETILTQGL